MIKEFFQPKRDQLAFKEGKEHKEAKRVPFRVVMDHPPQLSLGPSPWSAFADTVNTSNSESEANYLCRKRKHTWDHDQPMATHTSIELQLNDPLPLDWEQCLDLQSGRMYYLNRKTLKKSWVRPKEQKLDLELNMSSLPSSKEKAAAAAATIEEHSKRQTNSSSGSMMAVACLNCHLLVMLCKSSPSCPNCKYVHPISLPTQQSGPVPGRKIEAVKSLETLSLLH